MQLIWAEKMIAKGREEGIHHGREEGLSLGITRGREEGLSMGLDHGREEGIRRGLLEGARRALTDLLTARFGPLPEKVSANLEAIDELEELRQLTRRGIEVRSLRELGLGD